MTPQSTTRDVWKDTVVLTELQRLHSNVRYVAPKPPVNAEPPTPEEDADRWVKQVLFDCYND